MPESIEEILAEQLANRTWTVPDTPLPEGFEDHARRRAEAGTETTQDEAP